MGAIRAGTPFRQAHMMMACIAAVSAQFAANPIAMHTALANLGPYQGRGKGRTATHDNGGTRAFQRAALKKRNQARHRRACK